MLKQTNRQHTTDVDILMALATISRDAGDRPAAIAYAKQLIEVAPNNPQAHQLLDSLGA